MVEDSKAHRPVITGRHGMASTGHSLASCEALYVLKKGGNAMDDALAAAAVLSVIKSYHCGIGGDVFALYYSASDEKLYCLNGSGNLRFGSSVSFTKTKFLREERLRQMCREQ
jgi:gamma-glutamyltranspeptidase/glutathione hydrolase